MHSEKIAAYSNHSPNRRATPARSLGESEAEYGAGSDLLYFVDPASEG